MTMAIFDGVLSTGLCRKPLLFGSGTALFLILRLYFSWRV